MWSCTRTALVFFANYSSVVNIFNRQWIGLRAWIQGLFGHRTVNGKLLEYSLSVLRLKSYLLLLLARLLSVVHTALQPCESCSCKLELASLGPVCSTWEEDHCSPTFNFGPDTCSLRWPAVPEPLLLLCNAGRQILRAACLDLTLKLGICRVNRVSVKGTSPALCSKPIYGAMKTQRCY